MYFETVQILTFTKNISSFKPTLIMYCIIFGESKNPLQLSIGFWTHFHMPWSSTMPNLCSGIWALNWQKQKQTNIDWGVMTKSLIFSLWCSKAHSSLSFMLKSSSYHMMPHVINQSTLNHHQFLWMLKPKERSCNNASSCNISRNRLFLCRSEMFRVPKVCGNYFIERCSVCNLFWPQIVGCVIHYVVGRKNMDGRWWKTLKCWYKLAKEKSTKFRMCTPAGLSFTGYLSTLGSFLLVDPPLPQLCTAALKVCLCEISLLVFCFLDFYKMWFWRQL